MNTYRFQLYRRKWPLPAKIYHEDFIKATSFVDALEIFEKNTSKLIDDGHLPKGKYKIRSQIWSEG